MKVDHLVIVAEDLEAGARAVAAALGAPMQPGGQHPQMGTHNRLLSLGPAAYLEVIAVDPAAPAPGRPRWYGLDRMAGAPRLSNWAARAADIVRALAEAPMGMGAMTEMSRGDLHWQMAIPPSGVWPFDGVLPALINWPGATPHNRLRDRGLTLQRLRLVHPRMGDIRIAWPRLTETAGVVLEVGPAPALTAEIATPDGLKTISGVVGE